MIAGALLAQVIGDEQGIHERLERERSRMTHEVFLLAESGAAPDEAARRSRARAATARAWMGHIGASLVPVWSAAPPDLGEQLEGWFASNGERLEVIELTFAGRLDAGPIGDDETLARRRDLGAAARWLMEGIGAVCDPDGDGGPGFAKRMALWLDDQAAQIGDLAAEGRVKAPDDARVAESAELFAHVRTTVAALEAGLPDTPGGSEPSA